MTDEVSLDGKQFISSKRASQLSDYAQDYIGQLARAGLIEARRVGGLWYVYLESLNAYKSNAESYKPELPKGNQHQDDPQSVISFDGKQYVSAARAAKTTGYHQDYVGQLARSGKILSRQIGNRWYVDHHALTAHKEEKDGLLGAVQAESVGVMIHESTEIASTATSEPFFTYTADTKDLLPFTSVAVEEKKTSTSKAYRPENDFGRQQIAIRVFDGGKNKSWLGSKFGLTGSLAAALTIVIVLSVGFVSLKSSSIYAFNGGGIAKKISEMASTGNVGNVLEGFAEWLEKLFAADITYTRTK